MVARKNIKIASDYERICERILRLISCNILLFSGFALANVWSLGKKGVLRAAPIVEEVYKAIKLNRKATYS